jgi:hypothetical protein
MTAGELKEYAEQLARIEAGGNDGGDIDEHRAFCKAIEDRDCKPINSLISDLVRSKKYLYSPQRITEFRGEYFFLSNFYRQDMQFEGWTYPTSEHAFQAQKTADLTERQEFRIKTEYLEPVHAKHLGKKLTLRKGWSEIRVGIMEEVVRAKFILDPLRQALSDTYLSELVEGNTWGDTFWGVWRGEGQNHLGKILMKIRAEIRK